MSLKMRSVCRTQGGQLSQLSLSLPLLPHPAAGGAARAGICPAHSWQHEEGARSSPPALRDSGAIQKGDGLQCQGRLENSILPPPHRCIQFLSVFITPSCTGPASRVGGRSRGGLGVDFWNKLEVQVTHISLKIYVCLCVFLPI